MVGIEFDGLERVILNLVQHERDQQQRIRLACAEFARWLEAYAQSHHPWTLRTGATNVTTHGTWQEVGDSLYEVMISAGTFYDPWLEAGAKQYETFVGVGGVVQTRWSWLWPTLISQKDEFLKTLQRHLEH